MTRREWSILAGRSITMAAPVALKLADPSTPVAGWADQRQSWLRLNEEASGNPDFSPLTVKGGYMMGVIHDLGASVEQLLKHQRAADVTYLPAYGVFAAGVELLGRCIRGNATSSDNSEDLKMGFRWLTLRAEDDATAHTRVPDERVVLQTSKGDYSVSHLAALRHFAAHGQATSRTVQDVDYEILSQAHRPLVDGLERYWNALQQQESLCNLLAQANVIPLRNWPVLNSWLLMQGDGRGTSITNIFNRFDWHCRLP
jgi:hypothetical protein